ncbi:pectin esterase [Pedobacter sp. BS3]|uniref:pectinesterase family protein n=1 Tax=Pedobacter sp. BS3 TaxID=2567937 RepID=UPI0011EBBE9C|nr:pectinesterase family protein [Pedobacter sp. BS3]TZF81714.1 pectin esterase [Pedobacter sp. BS3]
MSGITGKAILLLAMILLGILRLQADTQPHFTVAQDGSGDFKTVQEAINAVPDFRHETTVIFIKNGVYKEKLILPGSKKLVQFIGESADKTILTYDDYATRKNVFSETIGTSGSSSFFIYGDDFSAENITFENSSGPVGQAVAVWVAADRCYFKNCRFLGFQDTLYTYSARQLYEDCYIEGTTDFIFGSATAVFNRCTIYCKKGGQYITAASTPENTPFGYVFLHCNIRGESGASYFLGRPWRPYARVVYLYCSLEDFIKPGGWDPWGKESNKSTAFYAEYKNSGPGFKPGSRVNWSHQLTDEEAKIYTIQHILGDWAANVRK